MKISTKGRYGTRFMIDMAINECNEPIILKDIAARQEISEKYLEQIVPALSRAGLIRSIRGAQGGYMLAQDPSKITIGAILQAVEGSLAPVECVSGSSSICSRSDKCLSIEIWKKVHNAINNVVDNITLADVVKDYKG